MVDAKQEYDNAKAMEQQRKNHEREERLKSFKGQQLTPRSPSDFHHHGIDALRAMIANANPEAIETSGHHWRASADRLGGQDGQGGIRKAFMDAVEHASAHWEGSAAQAFRREAGKVLEKIDRTYQHSRNVESTLIGSRSSGPEVGVAHNLRAAKTTMSKIHDPGLVDRAKDDSGDDSQFKRDMQNPKMDTRMALELNRDSLSLSKERQVEAVIVMDELAAHYDGQGKRLNDGIEPGGPGDDWPKPPSSHPSPPPVRMPVIGGAHPKDSSSGPDTPNGAGGHAVPKGFDSPHHVARPEVPVTTGLDSVQGGTLAPPSVGGGGISGGTPGGHGMPGGSGGGFPGGALAPGAIGAAGAFGAGGMRGGMPGAGLGAGKAGAAGAAGRGGPQARTRGGLAGKPGGPAGGAKQGGSGLHRSRGGKQAGMAGAPGAKGKGKGDKERGQRPDYLVEDEETWTTERRVAPRVIE
ncbi:hypothetical protein HXP44_18215 [Streptomyces sioyaensis]|uniref:PPE domain-containing protein n=1 Tax=Streptomyces sioyaensis TaxID=67364 RepID=A0A4Q1QS37_9ACTN|nr:hypothetical protein [Streptomyces sioyaensis]MBM4793952.1 hypothetical protein [Streptomyces sioyaensis]RXS59567.1 hypothetical protein EST54_29550 [Streptomyces sioyaensis]